LKPGDLIRSGWWIVVAAAAVSMVVAVWVVRLPRDGTAGGPRPFVLEPCLVDPDEVVRAMAPDGLVALTDPATLTPAEVDRRNESERGKLLVPSDRVVGVDLGGERRAYPLRLLRWHEVVNDVVGGRAVAVASSPLSGSLAVWDRTIDGRTLELGVSGRLLDSTTLMYDRRPDGGASSLWHQLTGQAIAGPLAGRRLRPMPAEIATWGRWRTAHPDTTVLAPDPGSLPLYKRDPYHSYRGSDVLRFPVDPLPPAGALARKDPVAIVTADNLDAAFPLRYLADAVGSARGTWVAPIGERVYRIHFDADEGTVAAEPNDPGDDPPAVRLASWFAWYAAHPDTVPLP